MSSNRPPTQAVAELDRLLPGRSPIQRTMSDVWGLVARMEAAGLAVRARCDGEPPPELVPTVYRVVQEPLTKALRYAQDGAVDIEVSTTGEGDATTVRVTTHGSVAAEPARRGYGLVGLGERVAPSGGSLEISRGPSSDIFEVDRGGAQAVDGGCVMTIRVLVVDDQELLRAGLTSVLSTDPELGWSASVVTGRRLSS
jgi:hypothetical protein